MAAVTNICVFCGSSDKVSEDYLSCAAEVGQLCASAGITIIYGGGRIGLMGALADAALSAGGKVIGVIPEFLNKTEIAHADVTSLIITSDMHQRKAKMAEYADAFIVLPGSVGTLEEMFEVIAWKQLKRIDKPIILTNLNHYWDPIVQMLDVMVDESFLSKKNRDLVQIIDSVEAILPTIGINSSL